MPGFGSGPFGTGGFGEWPWSLFVIVRGIPSVYREQDQDVGNGVLQALLEGLSPSMDGIRRKIRDYDDLRDPLVAPIEQSFLVDITILKTEDLGDGTSRVFLSEGADGDKFTGLRPGMTLIDFRGFRFVIDKVSSSSLATEFSDPPTDPATGLPTGKHIIVVNVGQSSTEYIPFVSGTLSSQENPAVDPATGTIVAVISASILEGETFTLDDGVNPAVVFEFDTDSTVAGTNIPVDISLSVSAISVADEMVSAINNAPALNLVADNGSGTLATVTIQNPGTGIEGNTVWSDTVADAGFVVTSPTGGGPGAFIYDGETQSDNGVRLSPYVFNVEGSYLDVPAKDIAANRVTIEWTEGGLRKSGSFTNDGKPGGDLADTSVIDFSASAIATGQIRLYNDSGAAIDSNSIVVTYTKADDPPADDAEIRAQNILAFLANDVGIRLDRNDPEFLQRSYVNNAFKIWDVKGTELGYDVLGQYAGYFVSARPLYSIIESIALGLPQTEVFEFPAGTFASGSITTIAAGPIIDGETFTLDDGINTPVVFEFDKVPDGVSPGNVVVDISADVTAVDVANTIVGAINGAASLNLNADNVGGTSNVVTITNAISGEVGNVTTWSDTVISGGFIVGNPTGGTNGKFFTSLNPGRPRFDELILDVLPVDLLCSDDTYPATIQAVTATSVTQIRSEGSNKRCVVVVTAANMEQTFNTDGVFTDFSGKNFDMYEVERIDATSYQFETANFVVPVTGVGTVEWKVLKFEAPNTVSITGLGTDVTDLGRQSVGYSGRRYRITKTFTDPILADIGNWAFIDSEGVISYIEAFEETETPGTYSFDIISASAPAAGDANIFLYCELVTTCDYCRASSIVVRISPTTILDYPEALEGDALGRLIIRLEQMIPGHVRIAAFIFDPGPAQAAWGAIAASSTSSESSGDDALYSSFYDEDEFPADAIPTDSAPIVASSEVTITNENVMEEYIAGSDPLVAGTWSATGLWHITEYRSSTQYRSFNYGQNDVGRVGDVGSNPPDYDGVGAGTVSRLISPSFGLLAADSAVVVRFRHYGDVDGAAGEDLVRVEVIRDTGPALIHTIDKTMLGLASGTNGSFTTYFEDIESLIVVDDDYHLEFVFDTGASPSGAGTGEGWYIDDIEVQVTP